MRFKEGLVSANTGLNVGTDFLSLVLTSLASVFTPLATVHALTAGAAISMGLKSTVATDVTSDDLINVTIAFDKIYFEPMAQFSEQFRSTGVTAANAPGILMQIDNYQEKCSLDSARVYIRQNLVKASPQAPTGQQLPAPAGVGGGAAQAGTSH
jgi:hypothetical protein